MDQTSPENVDAESTSVSQSGQWETPQVEETPDTTDQASPINENDDDQPQKSSTAPMQKRRRVTRACDECRRKKIKCDGKQPCTHCTVYSYECTYDQPSNRRRNAAPQYIEALETQLKRAKALLHLVMPNVDLNDPNLDLHLQNGILPQVPIQNAQPQPTRIEPQPRPSASDVQSGEGQNDSHLVSMVKATGQLDLDEQGYWDYHGHSSGLSFMRRMQQQFGDIITPTQNTPFVKSRPMSQVFDSPKSNHDSPLDSNSNLGVAGTDLPSKKEARILCDNALIDAGALLKIVHFPTFYQHLDRIYDTPPENYGNREHTFLPLLYAVMALGTLFPKGQQDAEDAGYESAIDEGFKYFRASRQLLDIADCRDLTSLQAIIFMIQFLQSSARLSTCYAYIGVAQRSALRMGLHRSFNKSFNPIEAETRKRIFWVIRKMDTYVGAMLGLPHFLHDQDIDQDPPTEVDDDYITETEIRPMPEGHISLIAGSNAHTRIIDVLAKIVKYIYPIKGTQSGGANSVTYSVSYSKIRELEKDLQDWLDGLHPMLKPGSEAPKNIVKIQLQLRMAFAHAQMMLYRPFIHYVSQTCRSKCGDQRAFACASACISVSRNIIHITSEQTRQGFLLGAYWFTMYTTFFAILSLIYYALENPSNPTSNDLLRDAMEGKEVLAQLAKRSMAADRCTATLKNIFDKLPERLHRGREMSISKKRRQETSPKSMPRPASYNKEPDFIEPGPRRASTFPEGLSTNKRSSFGPGSLPISQSHFANLGLESPYEHSPALTNNDFFESAPSLTPTSATTSSLPFSMTSQTPQQRPLQSFPPTPIGNGFLDTSALNVPLSDMTAMMFPSADPFAYPNQPMTTFENNNFANFNIKEEVPSPNFSNFGFRPSSSGSGVQKPHHPLFNSNGIQPGNVSQQHNGQQNVDSDVQLFGPMPMYLMQGAQHASAQNGTSFNMPGAAAHNQMQLSGHDGQPGNVNLDELFSGEEWANTFMDQGLGLGGFGNNNNNMNGLGNWR